jgi:hypothetical protein
MRMKNFRVCAASSGISGDSKQLSGDSKELAGDSEACQKIKHLYHGFDSLLQILNSISYLLFRWAEKGILVLV